LMRATIEELGGEIRFETRVTDMEIDNGQMRALHLSTGERLEADHVVLAVGHSARDTFQMLYDRGVHVEAKPFSIGFRIEHPQSLIDRCRFGPSAGNPILGAADYKLVHHCANGRSVYSFCMCPGGTVVAATSEPGRVVTNGMSQYSRNERNANAGIVVGIDPRDYPGYDAGRNPLAGIELQRGLESHAFVLGGGTSEAPGQLVGDFVAGRPSTGLGSVMPSYKPGVAIGDLSSALPSYAIEAMREALPAFGQKIKGFDLHDAVLTGVETRTSSPIKMSRGDDLQSLNVRGLYPAGEGASYAGGILSAGVDGIKVAEAVARTLLAEAESQRLTMA
ncbi:MAG: FAD-dependent oxidoreductase, partial [Polaromonas sp.]|nr:FAD-dependent oxidoreductase [Polaromonas sp.]